MKKNAMLLILFIFATLTAKGDSTFTVENFRRYEAAAVGKLSKGIKYCAELLFSGSRKVEDFKKYLQNDASPNEIKIYASITGIIAFLASYKLIKYLFGGSNNSKKLVHPKSASASYTDKDR